MNRIQIMLAIADGIELRTAKGDVFTPKAMTSDKVVAKDGRKWGLNETFDPLLTKESFRHTPKTTELLQLLSRVISGKKSLRWRQRLASGDLLNLINKGLEMASPYELGQVWLLTCHRDGLKRDETDWLSSVFVNEGEMQAN